jgi:DNA-binding NtrC family response regulator
VNQKHILVVDDEQNLLYTIEFILAAANYKVTTTVDGRDALDKILIAKDNHSPFDLLITDLRMPGLTGFQLLEELNRSKVNIPVFVITGHGNKDLVVELMRKGCAEYLDKPFDDEEFVERVGSLFAKEEQAYIS